jgi:hypothetical protein
MTMAPSETSYRRDPVSELFDGPAGTHLRAAYARPGSPVSRPLIPPTMAHRLWAVGMGINLDGADPAKAAVGTVVNRWDAALERALYWRHRWFWDGGAGLRAERRTVPVSGRTLRVEFSARARRFTVGPRSFYARTVRLTVVPGGDRALRAVMALAPAERIYDNRGEPAGKHSDPADRDWQ